MMTKETKTNALSRRKLLGRIGVLAAAGYTVPALTTLSMAQAGSGASGGGDRGGASGGAATPAPNAAAVAAVCGPENLNDPVYLQCLVTNGF
jgi:hypothetical protein